MDEMTVNEKTRRERAKLGWEKMRRRKWRNKRKFKVPKPLCV